MRALLAATRADATLLTAGGAMTLVAVVVSTRAGSTVSLGTLVAFVFFFTVVVGFLAFPHVVAAAMIPLFALIPPLKLFVNPAIGPVKDAIVLAAITAVAVLLVQRASTGRAQVGDFWAASAVCFLLSLYILNLGGGMERDLGWIQGVRLASEPMFLLLVGLTLPQAGRTLEWAMKSLIATGCFVAGVGVFQQVLGGERLVEMGYSYSLQVTHLGERLRSFGTMDDPFTYAAFLLLALVGVLMWARRGVLPAIAGLVILAGLAVAYVRTSVVILIALLGLWLARSQRPTISAFVLAVAVTSAVTILIASSPGSESQTTRAGPSLFLTINGRTDGWKVVLDSPRTWIIGKGVGEVGTAAERATYKLARRKAEKENESAVDSGYFALIADVGFLGLVIFLGLIGRLFLLSRAAVRRGLAAGWLAVGLITVMLLDATTRDSFTGFPPGFLGMFLLGLALAAAAEGSNANVDSGASRSAALGRKRGPHSFAKG